MPNNYTWQPWLDYALSDCNPLPILEPPCKHCIHWNPHREYAGVVCCTAFYDSNDDTGMYDDFSCFESKPGEQYMTHISNYDDDLGDIVQTFYLQEKSWWDVDSFLTPIILTALRQFRANHFSKHAMGGVPGEYFDDLEADHSNEEFEAAKDRYKTDIDKVIHTFECLSNIDDGIDLSGDDFIAHEAELNSGLHLFAKLYRGLWD